ncbi:MAG: nucleotidyltransferase family protein [Brevibacillus sp.]|nr:nucleotidyltransferase family protein [Brevibacillus sp.]
MSEQEPDQKQVMMLAPPFAAGPCAIDSRGEHAEPGTLMAAVILAAGLSSRMGHPKQLLRLGDMTMLEHVVGTAVRSRCQPIVLVLGHAARAVASSLRSALRQKIRIVINPNYSTGLASSLKAGLSAIPRQRPCYVMLGDQPLVSTELMTTLATAYRLSGGCTIRPLYRGVPAHPVLLSPTWYERAQQISGDAGLRLLAQGSHVITLPISDPWAVFDVDTPEAYERLRQEYGRRTDAKQAFNRADPERKTGAARGASGSDLGAVFA